MGGELLSFDEALAELQMATHELRSLVAQGEIRAFRDEDSLKFRRTDILDLKKSRETQPEGLLIQPEDVGDDTLTVPEAVAPEEPAPGPEVKSAKHETEETELLAGIGQGESLDFLGLDETAGGPDAGGDTAQTVVPTIEIADQDMIDDTAQTVVPTVSADETDILSDSEAAVPPTAPALLIEEDEATEMATQEIASDEVEAPTAPAAAPEMERETATEAPLRFQDSEAVGADELDITTDDISAGATAGATAPRRSQQYIAEAAAVTEVSPLFLALAILTFAIFLFAVPIFYGMATGDGPGFPPYQELLKFLADKTIK